MKFHWLLLSLLNLLLWASPADAGRLLFWRYEANQSRLLFTTDERVQPRAQLIPNPTRIVIDLPGVVLGRPSTEQSVGGIIRSVRVGQFDPSTTRLVIELASGYTVNPQAVKVRGISPTQWTVTLPNPERVPQTQRNTLPAPTQRPPTPTPPPQSRTPSPSSRPSSSGGSSSSDVRITNNGIFIRLDKNGDKSDIRVEKSNRNRTVEINLPGAQLPSSLTNQTLAIGQYGIEQIKFEQVEERRNKGVRMTLTVKPDSPEWQAVYSRFDGVVLLPRGGFQGLERSGSRQPRSLTSTVAPTPNITTINAVSLANNNRQLVINGNSNLEGSGRWNRNAGVYEIRIKDAQLAENVQGPQLGRNSPIYQLRVRQEVGNTVVILVQPSLGVQFGNLSQPNRQQLALEVRSRGNRTTSRPLPTTITANTPQTIPVPPAPRSPNPPRNVRPTTSVPRRQQGKVLVVIDPGHGGKDPGAIGLQGLREKDVILPISQEVARILEGQGVQVVMTRKSDYFVSLKGRADMANRVGADLFVSIHANAVGRGRTDVNGFEIFYYGNRGLSETIHRSVMRSINIRDRGVKRARFYVLRNSRMPATLVEVGFLTGYEDSAKLRNASFRSQMAQAIARGVLEYIQRNRL